MLLYLLATMIAGSVQEAAPPPEHARPSNVEAMEGNPPGSQEAEIVVRGEPDPEVDAGNRSPRVVLGSRIPQMSLQRNPHIASATSLGGLNPGSGMDAFERETAVRWKSCKVPGFAISSSDGCALRKARKALDTQQWPVARAIIADLTARPELSLDGQYLAHRLSYQIAASTGDHQARREALAAMIATGLLSPIEEPAAVRTLAAMALSAGDTDEAIARYREVTRLDGEDYRSRINLGALLQRKQDEQGARLQFLDAIAIMQRSGVTVPPHLLEASQ